MKGRRRRREGDSGCHSDRRGLFSKFVEKQLASKKRYHWTGRKKRDKPCAKGTARIRGPRTGVVELAGDYSQKNSWRGGNQIYQKRAAAKEVSSHNDGSEGKDAETSPHELMKYSF